MKVNEVLQRWTSRITKVACVLIYITWYVRTHGHFGQNAMSIDNVNPHIRTESEIREFPHQVQNEPNIAREHEDKAYLKIRKSIDVGVGGL